MVCPRPAEGPIAGQGPLVSAHFDMDEEKRTVKRTFGILAVFGVVVWFGNPLSAQVQPGQPQVQQPTQPARPLQTRIGLVNMVQILKNYKKFQRIEEEIRAKSLALEKWLQPLRD